MFPTRLELKPAYPPRPSAARAHQDGSPSSGSTRCRPSSRRGRLAHPPEIVWHTTHERHQPVWSLLNSLAVALSYEKTITAILSPQCRTGASQNERGPSSKCKVPACWRTNDRRL